MGERSPIPAEFPAALRDLVEAELAAGNEIVEASSTSPAPPVGFCVRLARPVTTRPRADAPGIRFYDRNSSLWSGEFHDDRRFFFVLEPPHPPEPEPDMDAIRESLRSAAATPAPVPASASTASPAARTSPGSTPAPAPSPAAEPVEPEVPAPSTTPSRREDPVGAFERSLSIDYYKWHDGIGYDLDALRAADAAGRARIEAMLVPNATRDWRDVEALAALDTRGARRALARAARDGNAEIRVVVLRHAPHVVAEADRVAILVHALRTATIGSGLSQALDQVAEFHPPDVVTALLDAARDRPGEVAVHAAAMLLFVHGKSKEPFDWDERPFVLRFRSDDPAERRAAFRDLCVRIGADPDAS